MFNIWCKKDNWLAIWDFKKNSAGFNIKRWYAWWKDANKYSQGYCFFNGRWYWNEPQNNRAKQDSGKQAPRWRLPKSATLPMRTYRCLHHPLVREACTPSCSWGVFVPLWNLLTALETLAICLVLIGSK